MLELLRLPVALTEEVLQAVAVSRGLALTLLQALEVKEVLGDMEGVLLGQALASSLLLPLPDGAPELLMLPEELPDTEPEAEALGEREREEQGEAEALGLLDADLLLRAEAEGPLLLLEHRVTELEAVAH